MPTDHSNNYQRQTGARDGSASCTSDFTGIPRLMRMSEVAECAAPGTSLRAVHDWVHSFLAAPHPNLGRKGSVCPFVPLSIELDMIWMAEVDDLHATHGAISNIVSTFRDRFLEMEPTDPAQAINKAFMIVFSKLSDEDSHRVDEVQLALKAEFVDRGLMLGEFHAQNRGEGLRNPDFRPLRSPIPILAIRHMVESDLPFLSKPDYTPELRSRFLRAYLQRFAGTVARSKFDFALNSLIEAEIEKSQIVQSQKSALSAKSETVNHHTLTEELM